eukprot:2398688-Rhodomonas_salina.1
MGVNCGEEGARRARRGAANLSGSQFWIIRVLKLRLTAYNCKTSVGSCRSIASVGRPAIGIPERGGHVGCSCPRSGMQALWTGPEPQPLEISCCHLLLRSALPSLLVFPHRPRAAAWHCSLCLGQCFF